MRVIKLYDKDFTTLTTLTEVDFTSLSYRRTLREIGDCEFTVRLDREKVTDANLKLYNRIEVHDEGVVKFVGVIVHRNVRIDTAEIRCRELTYVLKRRIMGASYSVSGDISAVVPSLLSTVNAADDTGISIGDVTGAIGNVNTTFNRASAFDILKQITNATGNQYRLESDRTLKIGASVGDDVGDTVIFRYNTSMVSASNILKFRVEEDGDDIVTKVYGKSDTLTSTQEDSGLSTSYGVLEKYRDFRVVNTQTVLDNFTLAEVKDKVYSPDIELSPNVEDTFDVGDTVRIVLKNSLINIDDRFLVIEKRVQYKGDQKMLSVRINDLPNDLAEKLSERDRRLELLEKEL